MKVIIDKINNLIRLLLENIHKRRKVVLALSCIVVFVTTYVLILPAFTLDENEATEQGGIGLPETVKGEEMIVSDDDFIEHEDTSTDNQVIVDNNNIDRVEQDSLISDNVEKRQADQNQPETDKVLENIPAEQTLEADGKSLSVVVTYGEDAEIPDDARLSVSEITEKDTAYKNYLAQAENLIGDESQIEEIRIVDISIKKSSNSSADNKIEPNAPVDVKITYDKAIDIGDEKKMTVIHFADNGPEILSNQADGRGDEITSVEFTTDSFSAFATVSEQFHTQMKEDCIAYFSFDNMGDGFADSGAIALRNGNIEIAAGKSGNALHLNSANGSDYLSVTKQDGSPLLTGLDEFTISYWVRPTAQYSTGTSGNWAFFASPNAAPQNYQSEHYIGAAHTGNSVNVERYNSTNQGRPASNSGNGTNINEWHHVAVVYRKVNGTASPNINNSKLYIDGNLVSTVGSDVDLSTMLGNNSIFQIGKGNWGSGEGFRGYIDEFSVYNYALSEPEIDIIYNEEGMIVLSPLNSNGVLEGDNPDPNSEYQNVASTHYKKMTIDGHTVNGQVDQQYARINIPVHYTDGSAQIILPSNNDLSSFRVSDAENVNHSVVQSTDQDVYKWVLKGWKNIATGEYYDTSNGSVTATVNNSNLNVFYADWQPANYDYTVPNPIETADTSNFIDIGVWDYNELYNLVGAHPFKVDFNTNDREPRDTLASEEWYIDHTRTGTGDFVQFVDNTDSNNSWQYGTLGNTQARGLWNENNWSNYSGWSPRMGIVGEWGQETNNHVLSTLFDTSNEPGSGVNYLGDGNYLFSYDSSKREYSYDSQLHAAAYNKSEQRFYVNSDPKRHTTNAGYNRATGFLPFNDYNQALAYNNGSTNCWFGMKIEVDFWLPDEPGTEDANKILGENMHFTFRGDDDVWVFIDDKLALDIGGIHEALNGSIDFTTGDIIVQTGDWDNHDQYTSLGNLNNMGIGAGAHKLTFYYVERGANASNCEIKFNLIPRWKQPPLSINRTKVSKTWSENTPDELKNSLNFYLEHNGEEVAGTVVRFSDGEFDEETGVWTYIWDYLNPDEEYIVKERFDETLFDVESEVINQDEQWEYWAASSYDDETGFDGKTTSENEVILIGNGKSTPNGLLLNGNLANDAADIEYDIVREDSVENIDKWTVEESDTASAHFYLKNSSGQYLSITGTSMQPTLVNTISDASLFYLAPTGDVNDAESNHRLVVKPNGEIGVAIKKEGTTESDESADRVHIYSYRFITADAYNYTIVNNYKNYPIQFKKVSIENVSVDSDGLTGAEFSLYNQAPDTEGNFPEGSLLTVLKSVDGSDGYLLAQSKSDVSEADNKILTVNPGTYYMVETKAPYGYIALEGVISFEVGQDGILRFTQPAQLTDTDKYISAVTETIDGKQISVPTGLLPNTTGAELPYTGGIGTTVFYVFGSILVIGCGVYFISRRRVGSR